MKNRLKMVVVAHPDDETLFFGGLLLSEPKTSWVVLSVTDGNAEGRGAQRSLEFHSACQAFGVHQAEILNFPDRPDERLPVDQIRSTMEQITRRIDPPVEVYTHGILGEYGHPHHQDVSYAIHQTFRNSCSVWSVATNLFPEKQIQLTSSSYAKKFEILTSIYAHETRRFLHLLPVSSAEGFIQATWEETQNLYLHLTQSTPLDESQLHCYRELAPHLRSGDLQRSLRAFMESYLHQ